MMNLKNKFPEFFNSIKQIWFSSTRQNWIRHQYNPTISNPQVLRTKSYKFQYLNLSINNKQAKSE